MIILTNHTNLQYYRHPQKINRRVARYIGFLEDFNYQLKHIPRAKNHANALLRRPDYDDGMADNDQVTALPNTVFAQVLATTTLDKKIHSHQWAAQGQLEAWQKQYKLTWENDGGWHKGEALVVIGNKEDKKALLENYHNSLMVGHLGVAKTYAVLRWDYWWPRMHGFIQEYVRGCGRC